MLNRLDKVIARFNETGEPTDQINPPSDLSRGRQDGTAGRSLSSSSGCDRQQALPCRR
jgi:hypothetical protein